MGRPMSEAEIRALFESEMSLARHADCVVTVSGNEKRVFDKHGINRVEVIGHSIEVMPTQASFESREGFLFVGAVHDDRSPNADSLIWFLNEVFPRIQESLGNITFTVAGVNRSERIARLVKPSVKITGYLASLDDLYARARVFVAPTRYAAGIPHKIHEAAAHGLPVVATPVLAEQLGWTDRELAIGGTAEALAECCIATYSNEARWTALREAAISRVRQECSPRIFEDSVRRILEGV
jgi:glycosyltransferase involved in cell wall biosynthesis